MEIVGVVLMLLTMLTFGLGLISLVLPNRTHPWFKTTSRLRALAIMIGSMGLFVIGGNLLLGDEEIEPRTEARQPSVSPDEPILTASARQLATDAISGYPEVLDVDLRQDGLDLNLVLVVNASTSESRARELGDNFVRLVKTFSSDSPPDREIGRGSFSYLVGVYTPTQTQIALGAKSRNATRVTW
jgi:hypothetical protein